MNWIDYFFTNEFMPHGHCYLWRPGILWLHVVSDVLIFLSYMSIPFALLYVVYTTRTKLQFSWLLLMFAIFILACGLTHLMEIINVWHSKYFISGLLKAVTAFASVATVTLLVPVLPKIVKSIKISE